MRTIITFILIGIAVFALGSLASARLQHVDYMACADKIVQMGQKGDYYLTPLDVYTCEYLGFVFDEEQYTECNGNLYQSSEFFHCEA